jgi:very-short-patch-repair endonuclease
MKVLTYRYASDVLREQGFIKEYRFNPDRHWRFDYANPILKIAIEVEGGVWISGRHSRGKGMIADMEKYNWATINGWRVLRYTPQNLLNCLEDIKFLASPPKEPLYED